MKSQPILATTLLEMALLAAAALAPPPALAHGDAGHAKAGAVVKKEQTDWGIAGNRRDARRTVQVGMSDAMRFTPEKLEVRQSETVRFVIANHGKLMHEFVLGHKAALDEHAALMVKFPDMEHDAPYMAHVAPGQRGEIVWNFNRAGDVDFACLIAGHYQAGMIGKISVRAANERKTR